MPVISFRYGLVACLILTVTSVAEFIAAESPLVDAARQGEWERVTVLLDEGVDVTLSQGDGSTALHWAAYWNEDDSAARLLRAGADVNATTDLGVTALWSACELSLIHI